MLPPLKKHTTSELVHSFKRPWTRDRIYSFSDVKERKAGKPELEFSPAQEQALFRLVAQAHVPWKYIPAAMYEAPVDGKPAFAPCKTTCRNRWRKMTDMNPGDVRITDKLRRMKQKERMVRAYTDYKQRQARQSGMGQLQDISPWLQPESRDTGTMPVMSLHTASPSRVVRQGANFTSGVASTVDPEILSPPDSPFNGPTPPADSVLVNPEPDDGINLQPQSAFTILPIVKQPNYPYPTLPGQYPNPPTPIDVDNLASDTIPACSTPLATDLEDHDLQLGQNLASPLLSTLSSSMVSQGAEIPVPESNSSSSIPETADILRKPEFSHAEIEDSMHVPHGLIDFVKNKLRESQSSVRSMISSTESQQSRLSGQFPLGFAGAAWSPFQSGQQDTRIFDALYLADVSDNEIADKLKEILDGFDVDVAQNYVRTRNLQQQTALEVALARGNGPACQVLLQAGADIHALTSDGKTFSQYGRAARKKAQNIAHYVGIGLCRNIIMGYTRNGKATKRRQGEIIDPQPDIADIKSRKSPRGPGQSSASRLYPAILSREKDPRRHGVIFSNSPGLNPQNSITQMAIPLDNSLPEYPPQHSMQHQSYHDSEGSNSNVELHTTKNANPEADGHAPLNFTPYSVSMSSGVLPSTSSPQFRSHHLQSHVPDSHVPSHPNTLNSNGDLHRTALKNHCPLSQSSAQISFSDQGTPMAVENQKSQETEIEIEPLPGHITKLPDGRLAFILDENCNSGELLSTQSTYILCRIPPQPSPQAHQNHFDLNHSGIHAETDEPSMMGSSFPIQQGDQYIFQGPTGFAETQDFPDAILGPTQYHDPAFASTSDFAENPVPPSSQLVRFHDIDNNPIPYMPSQNPHT